MPLTRCSLSIHGALTEGVAENVSGKGREGNKEGKGTRGETSHHGVTYVTRVSAAPVEVEPRDDMMTGLAVIEGIDLDAEVPCFPHDDEHPADLMVRNACPSCKGVETVGCCRAYWELLASQTGMFRCECGHYARALEFCRIVEVLR